MIVKSVRPGYSAQDTEKLFTACRSDSLWPAGWEHLMTNGRPDPLAHDEYGNTPLHTLIRSLEAGLLTDGYISRDRRLPSLLAQPGVHLNLLNEDGHTPLFECAADSDRFANTTRWLLMQPSVDPDACGPDGMTPAHKAGYPGMLFLLVAAGADLTRRCRSARSVPGTPYTGPTLEQEYNILDYHQKYHSFPHTGICVQACLQQAASLWQHIEKLPVLCASLLGKAWRQAQLTEIPIDYIVDKRAYLDELNWKYCARDTSSGKHVTAAQAVVTRLLNGGYLHKLFDPARWHGHEEEALKLIATTLRDSHQREIEAEIAGLRAQSDRLVVEERTPLGDWRMRANMLVARDETPSRS